MCSVIWLGPIDMPIYPDPLVIQKASHSLFPINLKLHEWKRWLTIGFRGALNSYKPNQVWKPSVELSIPMRPPATLHRCNWNDAWQIQRWRVVLLNPMANLELSGSWFATFWSSTSYICVPILHCCPTRVENGKDVVVWKWLWSAVDCLSWDRFVWRTKPVKLVIQDVNAAGPIGKAWMVAVEAGWKRGCEM